MKKILSVLFVAFVLLLAACGKGSSDGESKENKNTPSTPATPTTPNKKYGVKSGIVEYQTVAMGITIKKILYFDNFGAQECEESFFDGRPTDVVYTDGTDRFTMRMSAKDKVCWVGKGQGSYGLGPKVDIDVVQSGIKRGRNELSLLPGRKVAGFDCEGYLTKTGNMQISMYGYKGVLMLLENKGRMSVKTEVVKAAFDVEVPAAKFQPLAGFTLKPMGQ